MKFSLTISDMNGRQHREITAFLNSLAMSPEAVVSEASPIPVAPPVPPVPMPIPSTAIPPMPVDTGDDDDGPVSDVSSDTVDFYGLPWDERIHAKTKAMNADRTWRKRRGVADHIIATVEAELRQRVAAPPVPPMPIPVATPPSPPVPVAPPSPPVPVAPPSPPAAEPVGSIDFAGLMTTIQKSMAANLIDSAYLAYIASELQVPAITALAADPIKIAQAYAMLQRDQRIAL